MAIDGHSERIFASYRRWWNAPGVPWIYLSGHCFGWRFRFKLPPDLWWRRHCARGECAYNNSFCPNGCPEMVYLDE